MFILGHLILNEIIPSSRTRDNQLLSGIQHCFIAHKFTLTALVELIEKIIDNLEVKNTCVIFS